MLDWFVFLTCVYFVSGGGVSVVGGVVQLVLLFQELWRRSEESGKTLSRTEVVCLKKTLVVDNILLLS